MQLENKNAVIYGAAGKIGSTVARAFAREGTRVFLAGRTLPKLQTLAQWKKAQPLDVFRHWSKLRTRRFSWLQIAPVR